MYYKAVHANWFRRLKHLSCGIFYVIILFTKDICIIYMTFNFVYFANVIIFWKLNTMQRQQIHIYIYIFGIKRYIKEIINLYQKKVNSKNFWKKNSNSIKFFSIHIKLAKKNVCICTYYTHSHALAYKNYIFYLNGSILVN